MRTRASSAASPSFSIHAMAIERSGPRSSVTSSVTAGAPPEGAGIGGTTTMAGDGWTSDCGRNGRHGQRRRAKALDAAFATTAVREPRGAWAAARPLPREAVHVALADEDRGADPDR